MLEQISYKRFFKNYLILIGVLVFVFGLLIYLTIVSKKSWNKNLKNSVETVLEYQNPGTWTIGNYVNIMNPFCMSAAAYEARNRKNGEMYTAIILRINSYYGPVAAVFVCDRTMKVDFVGYSSLHGRIANQIGSNNETRQILYWKSKIPDILKK